MPHFLHVCSILSFFVDLGAVKISQISLHCCFFLLKYNCTWPQNYINTHQTFVTFYDCTLDLCTHTGNKMLQVLEAQVTVNTAGFNKKRHFKSLQSLYVTVSTLKYSTEFWQQKAKETFKIKLIILFDTDRVGGGVLNETHLTFIFKATLDYFENKSADGHFSSHT